MLILTRRLIPLARRSVIVFLLASLLEAGGPAVAGAADPGQPEKDPWDLMMIRFEFDNDSFIGSDDAFSAGWSLQLHSQLRDEWDRAYASWIGKFPGLGDDGRGDRITRWAYGISQAIITPMD